MLGNSITALKTPGGYYTATFEGIVFIETDIQRYIDVPFSLIDRAKIFMIYVCSQNRIEN